MSEYLPTDTIRPVVLQILLEAQRTVASKVLSEIPSGFLDHDLVSKLKNEDPTILGEAIYEGILTPLQEGVKNEKTRCLSQCLGWSDGRISTPEFTQMYPPLWTVTNLQPPRLEWFIRSIARIPLKALEEGGHILDIGAGTGLLAQVVRALGLPAHITAIESATAWRSYIEGMQLKNVDVPEYTAGDKIPLDDDSIQVVWCYMVLHHIDGASKILAEASRCLVCSGSFVVVDKVLPWKDAQFERRQVLYGKLNVGDAQLSQPHPSGIPETLRPVKTLMSVLRDCDLITELAMRLSDHAVLLNGRCVVERLSNSEAAAYWLLQHLKKNIRMLPARNSENFAQKANSLLDSSDSIPDVDIQINDFLSEKLGILSAGFMVRERCVNGGPQSFRFINTQGAENVSITFPSILNESSPDWDLIDQAIQSVNMVTNDLLEVNHLAADQWFEYLHNGGIVATAPELDNPAGMKLLDVGETCDNAMEMLSAEDGTIVAAHSWEDAPGVFILPAWDSSFDSELNTNVVIIGIVVLKSWNSFRQSYPHPDDLQRHACKELNSKELEGLKYEHAKVLGWIRAIMEVVARPMAEAHYYPSEKEYLEALGKSSARAEAFRNSGHIMQNRAIGVSNLLYHIFDESTDRLQIKETSEVEEYVREAVHHAKSLPNLYRASRLWGFSSWTDLFDFYDRGDLDQRRKSKSRFLLYGEPLDIRTLFCDVARYCSTLYEDEEVSTRKVLELKLHDSPNDIFLNPTIPDPDGLCCLAKDVVEAILYEVFFNATKHGRIPNQPSAVEKVNLSIQVGYVDGNTVIFCTNEYELEQNNIGVKQESYQEATTVPDHGIGMINSILTNLGAGRIWWRTTLDSKSNVGLYTVAVHLDGLNWSKDV